MITIGIHNSVLLLSTKGTESAAVYLKVAEAVGGPTLAAWLYTGSAKNVASRMQKYKNTAEMATRHFLVPNALETKENMKGCRVILAFVGSEYAARSLEYFLLTVRGLLYYC